MGLELWTGKDSKFMQELNAQLTVLAANPVLKQRLVLACGKSVQAELCGFMGAMHIDRLLKVLDQQGVPWKRVGTKSFTVKTKLGLAPFLVQAVHDTYTKMWPMPWILGMARKTVGDMEKGADPRHVLEACITVDTLVMHDLYVPAGKKPPKVIDAYVSNAYDVWVSGKTQAVTVGTPQGKQAVMPVAPTRACSPQMVVGLKYPFALPTMETNNNGVWVPETAPDNAAATWHEQLREESKVVEPPKVDDLATVMRERKAHARWKV